MVGDDYHAWRLLFLLERVFGYGLAKGFFSLFTVWEVFEALKDCLPRGQKIISPIRASQGTDLGRARAFLRLSLNEGCLHEYLSALVWDRKSLAAKYDRDALVRQDDFAAALLEGIARLEKSVRFRVSVEAQRLDLPNYWQQVDWSKMLMESTMGATVKTAVSVVVKAPEQPVGAAVAVSPSALPTPVFVAPPIVVAPIAEPASSPSPRPPSAEPVTPRTPAVVVADVHMSASESGLIGKLQEAGKACLLESGTEGKNVLYTRSQSVLLLIEAVESVMRHRLQVKFWEPETVWTFVKHLKTLRRDAEAMIDRCEHGDVALSDTGKFRCFLLFGIEAKQSSEWLEVLHESALAAGYYPSDDAAFRSVDVASVLISVLRTVENLRVQLEPHKSLDEPHLVVRGEMAHPPASVVATGASSVPVSTTPGPLAAQSAAGGGVPAVRRSRKGKKKKPVVVAAIESPLEGKSREVTPPTIAAIVIGATEATESPPVGLVPSPRMVDVLSPIATPDPVASVSLSSLEEEASALVDLATSVPSVESVSVEEPKTPETPFRIFMEEELTPKAHEEVEDEEEEEEEEEQEPQLPFAQEEDEEEGWQSDITKALSEIEDATSELAQLVPVTPTPQPVEPRNERIVMVERKREEKNEQESQRSQSPLPPVNRSLFPSSASDEFAVPKVWVRESVPLPTAARPAVRVAVIVDNLCDLVCSDDYATGEREIQVSNVRRRMQPVRLEPSGVVVTDHGEKQKLRKKKSSSSSSLKTRAARAFSLESENEMIRTTPQRRPQQSAILKADRAATMEDSDKVSWNNKSCANCNRRLVSAERRFCFYEQLWFCSRPECCNGERSVLPGNVVQLWDFKLYPVSTRAKTHIEDSKGLPCLNVALLNPNLYATVSDLQRMRMLRRQLSILGDFVRSCPKENALLPLCGDRLHFIQRPLLHCYSLQDFVDVKSKTLFSFVMSVVTSFANHVMVQCPSCKAKGSVCPLCNAKRPVYPFQLGDVVTCPHCKSIFHSACWARQGEADCVKCLKIQERALKK